MNDAAAGDAVVVHVVVADRHHVSRLLFSFFPLVHTLSSTLSLSPGSQPFFSVRFESHNTLTLLFSLTHTQSHTQTAVRFFHQT